MKLPIKGYVESSMLDWDGMIAAVLYVGGCNFRCPFCQNSSLVLHPHEIDDVLFEDILRHLKKSGEWVDGVCITGGEPCVYGQALSEHIAGIRETGKKIKLDTNGAFPEILELLLKNRMCDYIAMDIKAPLEPVAYSKATGMGGAEILSRVKSSISLVMASGVDYEFRTTVVPVLHSNDDIEKIAAHIRGAKKFALQRFKPHNTLDPGYENEKTYPQEVLNQMSKTALKYVSACIVRGV